MSKQDAIDWIDDNLPTETRDGERVVVRDHDTDGEVDCSICGRPHAPTVEYHPVESLADQHHESMDTHLPDQGADAAHDAIAESKDRGIGHERFFEQYFEQS